MTDATNYLKSNAQRKGQFLFNKLRVWDFSKDTEESMFVATLWNLSNEDFDKIMEEYNNG